MDAQSTGSRTMGYKKIIGINDDQDSCDCCGKTGLKKVVWLEDSETLAIAAYGSTCAAKANNHDRNTQKCQEATFLAAQKKLEKEQEKREWYALQQRLRAS